MMASTLLQTPAAGGWFDRFLTMSQGARDALGGAVILGAILLAGWLVAYAVSWIVKHLLRLLRFNDGLRGLVGHPVLGAPEPAALAARAGDWRLLFAAPGAAFARLGPAFRSSLSAGRRVVRARG